MIKKHVGIAFGTVWLLGGCVPHQRIDPIDQAMEKQGVWFSGEYAHFQASDGGVYILRLPNPRDQRRFVALAPVRVDAALTCLALRIKGGVNGEVDGTDRPVFVVSKIVAARRIKCKNLS
ncbi:MAG: hypothetical protein BVN33_06660 [Proteobacteria bacterium ST_bin13]|nr:MAG: hypothetical protein BVN33_06660 [Proteobacteria bacterium ST_bin13]